jgi:hypothetical protein
MGLSLPLSCTVLLPTQNDPKFGIKSAAHGIKLPISPSKKIVHSHTKRSILFFLLTYRCYILLHAWNPCLLHLGKLVKGFWVALISCYQEEFASLLHIFLHTHPFQVEDTQVVMAM